MCATEVIDSGSIPGQVKPKTIKIRTASLLDVQKLEGHCEASTVCGREVGSSTGIDCREARGWHPLRSDTEGGKICLAPSAF